VLITHKCMLQQKVLAMLVAWYCRTRLASADCQSCNITNASVQLSMTMILRANSSPSPPERVMEVPR